MMQVFLYGRKDCHLCDEAQADLEALQSEHPHSLTLVDVDSQPELQHRYGELIPVVEVGPYRLKAPFTRQELAMTLGAVEDRARHIQFIADGVTPSGQTLPAKWTKADATTYWLSRHYMAVFNLFVIFYLGLPILAPALMKAGVTGPANLIYRTYGMLCHQLGYRSFYLFGEQAVYPRQAADVAGLLTFSQATGLGESSSSEDVFAARQFVGNDQLGYKIALCQRDVAIYGSILLFGFLFVLTGKRLPAIPWYLWILIGLVPIGIDGVSQLLSQPPLNFFPYRESTPFLRLLTGALFGFTTAWFGYPMVEESMRESRQILGEKLKRSLRSQSASAAKTYPR